MAPKKKNNAKASKGSEIEKDKEKEAERHEQLHSEYGTLTETLINLKRRAEQLRRDNKALQNDVNQIHMESQDYMLSMSKWTQKLQNAIVSLCDQKQQKLDELSNQREEMVWKHKEQVNGLKNEILEKETELAQLKLEIAELEDVKQQQLYQIAELEQKEAAAYCHHVEALHALKADSLKKKEQHMAASKQTMWEYFLKVNKDAPHSMLFYIQKVTEENHHLCEELYQLMLRTRALRSHHELLQTQSRQLQLEKEVVQELQHLRNTRQRQHKGSCCQLTDAVRVAR